MFDFVGQYWWLVFPLMGVVATIGRGWERSSRRRHQRRLEVLHAKAEIRAARRGVFPPYAGASGTAEAAAQAETVSQQTQLERLFATHDAVTQRWLDYELDVAKLIAFPAMSDGRQPLTAAFLRARKVADQLRPASAKMRLTSEQFTEYRNAVTDYEVAFDVAERDARRVKDSSFTEHERKRLDTAKQLLTVAVDQAATPAERQLAYKRVREELDGLISLSDGAIEVLEEKVALELAAGPTGAQAQPTAQAQPRSAPPRAGTWPVPSRDVTDQAPGDTPRPTPLP